MIVCMTSLLMHGCGGNEDYSKIDVDLTEMSSTMVYSEVFDMVNKPDDYQGKTVKMKGNIYMVMDEKKAKIKCYCIIADATKCCQQGMEFELREEPDKYPKADSEVTVVGVADKVKSKDGEYCVIKKAEFVE